jgi:hypothetical protein
MPEASADQPHNTTATEVLERTTVELQHHRGILYVYRRDGKPLLKITGLPAQAPRLDDSMYGHWQLTVEIREGTAVCHWGPAPGVPGNDDPRGDEAAWILKNAGATVLPGTEK